MATVLSSNLKTKLARAMQPASFKGPPARCNGTRHDRSARDAAVAVYLVRNRKVCAHRPARCSRHNLPEIHLAALAKLSLRARS
jgi:hypothetical protein